VVGGWYGGALAKGDGKSVIEVGNINCDEVAATWRPPGSAMAVATPCVIKITLQGVEFIDIWAPSEVWHGIGLIGHIMSQARAIRPGATYLVTRRTERRHCLLRPDPIMNMFIRYALVVAASQYGILIHAFCGMSTHFHYVVTDPDAQLPQFMAMFHRMVAIDVQNIRDWEGAVWDRSQASMVELCTRQAIVEKIAYTLANPVEAGLVRHAQEWPGVKTSVDDIGTKTMRAYRPRNWTKSASLKWAPEVIMPVSLPPSISASEADAFRAGIRAELKKLEAAAHAAIPRAKVLGVKGVLKVDPKSRILTREPKRQINPTFAVGRNNPEALEKAKCTLREFRRSYRRAFDAWRAGNRAVQFPPGTYAMRVFHGANVST
jgi:putative transposase